MVHSKVSLTDEQLAEMQHFSLQDGTGFRTLRHTQEVEDSYRSWLEAACYHSSERVLRRKKINSVTPQIVRICQECAMQFGGPVSHKEAPLLESIPWLGSFTHAMYEQQRREEWAQSQVKLYSNVDNIQLYNFSSYQDYLASEDWHKIRGKVMKRANQICEGCAEAKATAVHHLSYTHIGDEFLWELAAICGPCHDRAHPEKQQSTSSDD